MFRHLLCLLIVLTAAAVSAQAPPRATATLKNAQGEVIGTATLGLTTRGTAVTTGERPGRLQVEAERW